MKKTGICVAALCALTAAAYPSPKAQKRAAAQPAQELVIGDQFDLRHIDPAQGMLDDTQILVYNGLVEMDSQFRQAPALAESWTMSEDGMVWTFHLRKNVTFHDGTPWNAEAALANFKRLDGYPGLSDTERVETPDPYTLVFQMKHPTYTLSSNLARTALSMVSPQVIQSDGSITKPVGSGPYKLTKWERDREFVFEAYDGFWGGPPHIRKITFKVITDPQARASALEAGEIDMMSGYQSLPAVKRLAADPRFQIIKTVQNTSGALFYNLSRPPLDNKAVRRAIGHALDLNTMVANLLPGLASPPSGFFSPAYGDLVNPQVKNPSYDLSRAKALLEENGWTSGPGGVRVRGSQPLRLTLTYGAANAEHALLAQAIQDALRAAGVDLALNPVEAAALDDLEEAKNYDMILTDQSFIPTDDPSFHYRRGYWHSESYYKVYTSEPLDRLINELEITMDREKRRALHWDIQREIMDNAPVLIVYHRNSLRLAKKNIRNFSISSGCWHINRALKDAVIDAP
ncbi:MAG: ABC transporter substrate-binding protein [Spirochaetaceae bacterium]|jgi:peptide/nickel transport system substrate-binding protein|nr:ABC transporter substrate-binding protein [Spirochaetaceae bacterium]